MPFDLSLPKLITFFRHKNNKFTITLLRKKIYTSMETSYISQQKIARGEEIKGEDIREGVFNLIQFNTQILVKVILSLFLSLTSTEDYTLLL